MVTPLRCGEDGAMSDQPPPRVPRTVCVSCHGQGAVVMPVAAEDGTRMVPRKCDQCDGSGRLPGFVPPG